MARRLDGVVGVSLKDLKTGRTVELLPNEPFPTASSIKLAILYELARQADEGRLRLDETAEARAPRAGGDGVLQFLGDGTRLSLRDLAVLMMAVSDNEATNRLIDRVGREAVNRTLEGLGLRATRLRRRMMDVEAARRGDENVSTPAELRRLAEIVHAGEGLAPATAAEAATLAALPKHSAFRRGVPGGTRVLDKPGSLEGVRCVAAVVDLPGRAYAVAIMTAYLERDEDGETAIREISQAAFETLARLDQGTELGRAIGRP